MSLRSCIQLLCQQTGCSAQRLNRLFLGVEGITLRRYVLQQRIDKAIERLVYTTDSVGEIARQTGYHDEHHLGTHLVAERGLPPDHFLALRAVRHQPSPYLVTMSQDTVPLIVHSKCQ
ncbi:helix-turn-helix domain-containing protein [Nibrella saemangeumensis]